MGWRLYLEQNGFSTNDNWEYYKNLGFGQKLTVVMLMKGLFEIKKGSKVIFSNFVESFEEFKQIINETR